MKKRMLLLILGAALMTSGCSFSVSTPATPTLESLPATPDESAPPPAPATHASGAQVSFENISFVVPGEVASGASTERISSVEANSGAPWDVAPTHLRFTLTEYALQGRFHEPRLFVFPADEYAQINPTAAEQIDRLRKILAGAIPLHESLPTVPFFNAAQQISAQIKIIPFQNGSGIRFLTQYAQYAAPINNRELFYHFQGLTADGSHYVIAILPVTAPLLAEDERPEATVPEDGVPIPADVGPNAVYYFSVTEKLNSLAPEAFTPSLSALDALIGSITINP